jgi:hypothetical protein
LERSSICILVLTFFLFLSVGWLSPSALLSTLALLSASVLLSTSALLSASALLSTPAFLSTLVLLLLVFRGLLRSGVDLPRRLLRWFGVDLPPSVLLGFDVDIPPRLPLGVGVEPLPFGVDRPRNLSLGIGAEPIRFGVALCCSVLPGFDDAYLQTLLLDIGLDRLRTLSMRFGAVGCGSP